MAAYMIIDVEVTDDATYEGLAERAAATVQAHGGRHLVRAGSVTVLQGDWKPRRLVVVEFDSAETARRWRSSSDAIELREKLNRVSNANILMVEGK